ncbi:MAG: hypothetical protein ACYC1K_03510 [Minisyncoccota bacterium]
MSCWASRLTEETMLTALDEATYGNETAESELRNVRGLLLWALYHHQGGSSVVGQPIRKVLGIGEYDHMTHEQIEEFKWHE